MNISSYMNENLASYMSRIKVELLVFLNSCMRIMVEISAHRVTLKTNTFPVVGICFDYSSFPNSINVAL